MSYAHRNFLKYSIANTLFLSLVVMGSHQAAALPQDGVVAQGAAQISTDASTMAVAQSSDKAIINWKSFDIASGETVNFVQPSTSSIALNRVTGSQNASQIFGALNANGKIILVNPQGVLIGAGAKVNVGSFVATTANIDDDRFMAGDMTFDKAGNPKASIINKGNITVEEGGLVALIGPQVVNDGLIQARLGKVHLGSGDVFTIDLYGDGLITLQATEELSKQLVDNGGSIVADGGEIILTAAAAKTTLDSMINVSGLLQADSVGEKNGHIVLAAKQGSTTVSGTITARGNKSGEKGGAVEVLGHKVTVASGAKVDVSGKAGGGSLHVGGAYQGSGTTQTAEETTVAYGSELLANAEENGDGGEVIVWSDDETVFDGLIEARGGAEGGNGGFVETSGESLTVDGLVDAGAVAGEGGTWLLDPSNLIIANSGGPSVVKVSSIQNSLNLGSNLSFWTSENIEVRDSIKKTSGKNASLTLKADGSIVLEKNVTISSTNNKLNVVLKADDNGNGDGSVIMKSGSGIFSNGGDISLYGHGSSFLVGGILLDHAALVADGGNISMTGIGYSSKLFGASYGVQITHSSLATKGRGTITINGLGGNSGLGFAGINNYGVLVEDSSISAKGSGLIAITGTGGDNTGILSANNYGVRIEDSQVRNTGGSVEISGFGGDNTSMLGNGNGGLYLDDATVTTTSGDITLTGVGGTSTALLKPPSKEKKTIYTEQKSTATGIVVDGRTFIGSLSEPFMGEEDGPEIKKIVSYDGEGRDGEGHHDETSTSGDITFIADTIDVDGEMRVETDNTVTFKTYNAGTSIGVAGASGTLQLTKSILDDVDADRIVVGDLSDGSGLLSAGSYKWNADVEFLTKTGQILLVGLQDMQRHTFLAQTAAGNIQINAGGGVKSFARGAAITLAASYGHFYNYAGSHALSAPKGNWLIYSTSPFTDRMGGLVSDYHRYSCIFGGDCPELGRGNGNLYRMTPYLFAVANGTTTTYGQAANFSYSLYGYLFKDALADAVTGSVNYWTNYTVGSNVGTYKVKAISGDLASAMGYKVVYLPLKAKVVVNPATLYVTADNKSWVYGSGAFPALTYSYEGLVNGDTDSVFAGGLDVLGLPISYFGDYVIGQGSLSAGLNYNIVFTDGVFTVEAPTGDITSSSQQDVIPPAARGLGYKGILLAMAQNAGGLGGMAPAAGGGRPMTPEELSNLAPAAGGNMAKGGAVALIECSDATPCQIDQ